tara:strand:- start:675 stop:1046 length:372 start_codon:yes stop_codon:yes gene_type:complete
MGERLSKCLDSLRDSEIPPPQSGFDKNDNITSEEAGRIVKKYGILRNDGTIDLSMWEEIRDSAEFMENSTPVSARETSSFILPGGGKKLRKNKNANSKKKTKKKKTKKKKIKTKKNKTKRKRR